MYPYELFLNMNLYSICFLVAVLFALFFVNFAIEKKGFSSGLQRLVLICGFLAVVAGLGGAILFQAFYNFMATGEFVLESAGMTFFGGLIVGVVVFVLVWFLLGKVLCKDKTEPIRRFPDMLDVAAACMPIAHGFGRLGCFFAGCCHGAETDAWYGVNMYTPTGWKRVVPVQLFEAIFLFALGAILLLLFFARRREKRLPLMSFYAFFYGIWRYVIEFFRADDRGSTVVSFMTPSQLVSVCLILFGALYFVGWLLKKKGVFEKVRDRRAFQKHFGKKPEGRYVSSGRINLIGEHIDYCGGKVMPAALGLKCYVLAAKNDRNCIRILFPSKRGVSACEIALDDLSSYREKEFGNYQAGVAYELQKAGVLLVGCDLYYRCDVPFGGSLSSSAAIEVATATALLGMANATMKKEEVALLCQRAENEFVGVNCGIMDQFISALGKKDCATLLDCQTLAYTQIPLDLGKYTFLLAHSNRPHKLTDGDYNERRREAEGALSVLQTQKKISSLSELSVEELSAAKDTLSPVLYARAMHVVSECARVEEGASALKTGDMERFGKLLSASHESLKALYEVTCEETDILQGLFLASKGCVGARQIGGGFGGCVLALVERRRADECCQKVVEGYEKAVGYPPTFYPVEIEDGSFEERFCQN